MGAVETAEEQPPVDQTALDQIIEHAMRRAPALATAGLLTSWMGLRPVTPDDDLILGRAPRLPNFFNDCG
jgi:glycine/D-amino acid oxidase-like deaminating enzyme